METPCSTSTTSLRRLGGGPAVCAARGTIVRKKTASRRMQRFITTSKEARFCSDGDKFVKSARESGTDSTRRHTINDGGAAGANHYTTSGKIWAAGPSHRAGLHGALGQLRPGGRKRLPGHPGMGPGT